MGADANQPMSPAQVFGRGWRLWLANFGRLTIGTLVVFLPMQLLNLLVVYVTQPAAFEQIASLPKLIQWFDEVARTTGSTPPPLPPELARVPTGAEYSLLLLGQALSVLIAVVGTALFLSLAVQITTSAAAGEQLGWRAALDAAVDRVRSMAFLTFIWGFFLWLLTLLGVFVAGVLAGIAGGVVAATGAVWVLVLVIPVAVLVALLPAVWLAVMWAVPVPALIYEGRRNFEALSRSYRLVRGRVWATSGTLALLGLIWIVLSVLALAPGAAALLSGSGAVLSIVLLVAGGLVVSIIGYPLLGSTISAVYLDLRLRKEGAVPERGEGGDIGWRRVTGDPSPPSPRLPEAPTGP
jgi:hypothetical protein